MTRIAAEKFLNPCIPWGLGARTVRLLRLAPDGLHPTIRLPSLKTCNYGRCTIAETPWAILLKGITYIGGCPSAYQLSVDGGKLCIDY